MEINCPEIEECIRIINKEDNKRIKKNMIIDLLGCLIPGYSNYSQALAVSGMVGELMQYSKRSFNSFKLILAGLSKTKNEGLTHIYHMVLDYLKYIYKNA